jgi:hypothetical protein
MVIKNSTPWRTDDLKALFRRCIKEVERIEKPNYPFHKKNKHFKLDILNGNCFRGRATVSGYWIMIKIPRNINWDSPVDWIKATNGKEALAKLIIHEYYHTIGFVYQDKNHYKHDTTKRFEVSWANDYQIRQKEIAKKEPTDIKMVRYQKAILNLRRAETRLKRAKTIYKKWQSKVNYYGKVYNNKE